MTQQSTLATQPSNGIDSQSQAVPEPGSWAKLLYVSNRSTGCAWVKENVFKLGKIPDCDLLGEQLAAEIRNTVSKVHFVIERRDIRGVPVGYISDRSSNGTFLNGEIIGKNNQRILGHNDFISIVKTEWRMFRFQYLPFDTRVDVPDSLKMDYCVVNDAPIGFTGLVEMDYHVVETIAKGRFSQIHYVLNKKTCQPFAMKVSRVSMNINEEDGVLNELKILPALKHENIIAYHDKILKGSQLFLVVEFVEENLSDILRWKGRLFEPVVKHISRQIASALVYLHSVRIVHKNLQPKNILLTSRDDFPTVKIKNFRFSKKQKKQLSTMKTVHDTSVYHAPELKHPYNIYDTRADVWSFGVILYVCLCGKEPVEGVENNAGGRVQFCPSDTWSNITRFAQNVIETSMVVNFKNRIQSTHILCQPWFMMEQNLTSNRKRPNPFTEETLKKFKSTFV